ncbi:hypothetical protein SteCoe_9029 [Stentor coeruleus]|uniref:Uncharacterized protein n=1 Tax=Stentor coeruleus TaxID=5963 RepID=A0A1R2CIU8_9CILI|nr:hypothetical protein SteCoe_9029 [Stentor coeruleus]
MKTREIDTHESEQKPRKSKKNSLGMIECNMRKYYISTSKLVDHATSCKWNMSLDFQVIFLIYQLMIKDLVLRKMKTAKLQLVVSEERVCELQMELK